MEIVLDRTANRTRALVASTLSITTVFGMTYGVSAFYPSFVRDLDAGATELAVLTAVVTATYFWLGSTASRVADRIGVRALLLFSAATVGVGVCGAAAGQSMIWVFGTFTIGLGITVACGYVPTVAMVGRYWQDHPQRPVAMGVATAGVSVGTLVAAPAFLALIVTFDWRTALVVTGIVCAVLLVVAAIVAPPRVSVVASTPPSLIQLMHGDNTFGLLYISLALLALPRFLPFTLLVPFAHEHGIEGVVAGLLLTAVGIGGLVSRAIVGFATQRLGPVVVYRWCAVALGASYAIWLLPPEVWSLMLFGLLMGAAYGAIIATFPEIAIRVYGGSAFAAVLAKLYTANGVGALICLVGAGLLIDLTGDYTIAIAAGTVLAMASGLVTWRLRLASP